MIKHILIDWFEVFSNGIYGAGEMGRLIEKVGLSLDDYMLKDNGYCWDELQKLNRGIINEKRYWRNVIQHTGWKVTVEQMMAITDEAVRIPILGTLDVAKDLHAKGYQLILISDLGFELKERILLAYPWIKQLFGAHYFSCDYGKIKADQGYFEFILNQEGINPNEALFIDDYFVNVARAEDAGIQGIIFKNALQLKQDLCAAKILSDLETKSA